MINPCAYGSVALHQRREDRPRNPELKDSEERLPIRPLEFGASIADSQTVGFGRAFGRTVADDQEAERRVKRVQLISRNPLASNDMLSRNRAKIESYCRSQENVCAENRHQFVPREMARLRNRGNWRQFLAMD